MAIARAAGWEGGVRSGTQIYPAARPLALLDIDWKRPHWERHLKVAAAERPALAAVPDLECESQLPRLLEQAEELAPFCESLLIIPKTEADLPGRIGGRPVILGYSVPTTYGGCPLMVTEFRDRPVHLLGGSPNKQRRLCGYLNVVSMDGNMAWRLAQRCTYYDRYGGSQNKVPFEERGEHGPLEALRRSLANLNQFWGWGRR